MSRLEPGQVFAGHRIERVAGQGGMGVVYAATDLRLKRLVALKVIAPQFAAEPNFQQRFERECELAASVDHPGVIPIYSAGEEEGAAYVTMRFVDGTDLARMITRAGRLSPELVATVAEQVGDALDAAHARGLVHRDVKPANVLVRERGRAHEVFLTDFGLTRELTSETRLTATGAVIGTVDYMAPEQFEDRPLDARTDVYALGCVLYQALTGSVPFPTESAPAKLFAHTNADRPSLRDLAPELPQALDRVVQKAMAKQPDQRFQSAGDLGTAATAAIEDGGGDATAAVGLDETEEAAATGRVAEGDSATSALPPPVPPPPPIRRELLPEPAPEPPPPRAARRRRDLIALALGLAAVLTTAAIVYVVFIRDSGEGGADRSVSGGTVSEQQSGSGGESGGGEQTASSRDEISAADRAAAASVPAGMAAVVESYERGGIEREGFERRARLVELRDPGTTGETARSQALGELIFNRWVRARADASGIEVSDQVDAELASPEFAPEVERLRAVGYLEGGIRLDAEARLAAESLFGEGSATVDVLTEGYDPASADKALTALIPVYRPDTACAADLAPLSPFCVNGPEP
ncbi:MAG: serine/threonine-protein kinase [Solirubrobacterales bacterium]